jgi:chorismate synthase
MYTRVHHMPTGRTCKSTESKLRRAVGALRHEKRSVLPSYKGRVAASAIAEKYLTEAYGIEIVGFVASVGHVSMTPSDDYEPAKKDDFLAKWKEWWQFLKTVSRADVDSNEVRCPLPEHASRMRERIVQAKEDQNSIGGCVVCVIRNLPFGLGEPCFEKFEVLTNNTGKAS